MDLALKNQTVLITGSSRGIGRGISEEFLKEKAKVFITGRDYKTLENTFLELSNLYGANKIFKFNGDLNDSKILKKLYQYIIDKNEGLDHIICNIGNGNSVSPLKEDRIEFKRMLDINLLNAISVVDNLYPLLKNSVSQQQYIEIP